MKKKVIWFVGLLAAVGLTWCVMQMNYVSFQAPVGKSENLSSVHTIWEAVWDEQLTDFVWGIALSGNDIGEINIDRIPWTGEKDNEALWQICTEMLGEENADSWEHDTYRLYVDSRGKEWEILTLYRTEPGKNGFFFTGGKYLYQVVFPEEVGKQVKNAVRRNQVEVAPDLWGSALRAVCQDKKLDDGIAWKDSHIRSEVHVGRISIEGNIISQEDILGTKRLRIQSAWRAKTFQDLEQFTGLEALEISGYDAVVPVADMDFDGSCLPKLTNLTIRYCGLTNITFVTKLPNLTKLDLSNNQIEDISPLKELSKLVYLNISDNRIQDFSAIQDLEELCTLWMTGNHFTDIGALVLVPSLMCDSDEWNDYDGKPLEEADVARLLELVPKGQKILEEWEDLEWSWNQRHVSAFISGDRLVIQCFNGGAYGYCRKETYVYERDKGQYQLIYEMSWEETRSNTGNDRLWHIKDVQKDIDQTYAISDRGHLGKALIEDSRLFEEKKQRETIVEKALTEYGDMAGGVVLPEITFSDYAPGFGYRGDDYEFHEMLCDTEKSAEWVLDEAARMYLKNGVKLPVSVYTSEEIKENYDHLTGVKLPDYFYLGFHDGEVCILYYFNYYDWNEVTERNHGLMHCEISKEGDWEDKGFICFYYEATESFK